MSKYLYSVQYDEIIEGTFYLRESDLYKYFQNTIEEHYRSNQDIVIQMRLALNRKMDWYRDKVEELVSMDERALEKEIKIDLFDYLRERDPRLYQFHKRSVNNSFFITQMIILDDLKLIIDFKLILEKKELLFTNDEMITFGITSSQKNFDFNELIQLDDIITDLIETRKEKNSLIIEQKESNEFRTSTNIGDESGISLKLEDLFEDPLKYKIIMDLIVGQGYCQKDTYIWKYKKSGYINLCIAIILHIQNHGYFKRTTILKASEITQIAINTFKLRFSISAVHHFNEVDKSYLSFIPLASMLNLGLS